MYFLAILFTLASAAAKTKYMPNIEYFLRGYNIWKANPHITSVSVVDPGFQEPIFKLSYGQGTTTPDDKYFSPDGTLVTICQACSLSSVTKKISGMHSYRDSLSEKVRFSEAVTVGWPWWENRFSSSVDYQKVQTETASARYDYFYTHSDASCCAYQVQTDLYKPPPFSSDFLRGIITLPHDYTDPDNIALYRKFIESFGTNYIKQTDMGSLFGQETKITKVHWQAMLTSSIDIERTSSWSNFFATGHTETSFNQHKAAVATFNSLTESQTLYTKGSKPPTNGSLTSWVNESKEYPAPIALELGSLLDLFVSLHVPPKIIQNMKEALENYAPPTVLTADKPFP